MKEVQTLMARADKYLKSAKLLIDEDDNESAVSRAYYAMFYAAEAVLLTKGLASDSHKGIISIFGEHFIKTGVFPKNLGRYLNQAFNKRQVGDYSHDFVFVEVEAEQVLAEGHDFVKQIRQYLTTNGYL